MINSRDKGKRGERRLSRKLNEFGFHCRRGQQYSGASGDADVIGLTGIHIECKWVERLNIYNAVAQAVHDARSGELPAVFHCRNNCEWLVTMRLSDWVKIYLEYLSSILLGENHERKQEDKP